MNIKRYRQLRAGVVVFVGAIIAVATRHSFLLSFTAVVTGMLFLILARTKTKVRIDEREKTIREKSAQLTYAVFAPTLGIIALLLLIPSQSGISVFAKGEWVYIESLGTIFAYLSLLLIAIYSFSYYFLNRKYGGNTDEE